MATVMTVGGGAQQRRPLPPPDAPPPPPPPPFPPPPAALPQQQQQQPHIRSPQQGPRGLVPCRPPSALRAVQAAAFAAACLLAVAAGRLRKASRRAQRPAAPGGLDAAGSELVRELGRLADVVGSVAAQQRRLFPPDSDGDARYETDAASRWQHLDWMPPRRRSQLLLSFQHHPPTPEWRSGERRLPCGSPEADRGVAAAARVIENHLRGAHVRPEPTPQRAVPLLMGALRVAPGCATARLNLAILLVTGPPEGLFATADGTFPRPADMLSPADFAKARNGTASAVNPAMVDIAAVQRAAQLLAEEQLFADTPLQAKGQLWLGFALELLGSQDRAAECYLRVYDLDPAMGRRYFGRRPADFAAKRPRFFFRDHEGAQGAASPYGQHLYGCVLRRLLLYAEYGEHFAGNERTTRAQALDFIDQWRLFAPGLFPAYVVRALQDGYRRLIANGDLPFQDNQGLRYFKHNDPVQRYLGAVYNDFVSRVTDYATVSTYAYMGAYIGGAELKPHRDRHACEWTLTVASDVNPSDEICPLTHSLRPNKIHEGDVPFERSTLKKPPPDQQGMVFPRPGDGLLFRGRGLLHWREAIPAHMNCTNIFLHYVLADFSADPLS